MYIIMQQRIAKHLVCKTNTLLSLPYSILLYRFSGLKHDREAIAAS